MSHRWLKVSAGAVIAAAVALAGSSVGWAGSRDPTGGSVHGSALGAHRSAMKVDVAAAKAAVTQYTGKPTAFPVNEPLNTLPKGKTFAYLQCSTPDCALFKQLFGAAGKMLGFKLVTVEAGTSATQAQTAMDSILALKPAGVLLPAVEPDEFPQQMKKLEQAKTPVSADGIVDPGDYGIKADFINNYTDRLAGKLMADWSVAQTGGGEVVFYGVPELSFTSLMRSGFSKEMAAVCSSCTVRYVDIPAAAIGTTAVSQVVSDLQSNPNTKAVVFDTAEAGIGLPAALKAAGINVKIIGWGPPPAVLGYIKAGTWTAALGVDGPTMLFSQADALAREVAGQPLTAGEKLGLPPIEILNGADIGNPQQFWTGYPNYATRFAKLWGLAK